MSKLFITRSGFRTIWKRNGNGCCVIQTVSRSTQVRFSSGNGQNVVKQSSRIKWFWMPAGFGFALISVIQLRHIQQRERRRHAPLEGVATQSGIPPWQVNLFKVLPTRALSRFWGSVHDIELPTVLRGPVVRLWTWAFNCCLEEAEETDPSKYKNLGEFFTRKLKQGSRDIDKNSELVSPVDGRILHFGKVTDGKLEQIKSVPYSLESFLGQSTLSNADHPTPDNQLYQCVLYLGPGDCHHFHSPAEWDIETRRHFPGKLYSVSPWVLKGFRDVFCTNERVSLYGNWKHGIFTMTAVGAYNVGSINVHFDDELRTNQKTGEMDKFHERKFNKSKFLGRGDHIGWFAMGSAVVLIFEGPKDFEFTVKIGQNIKLGQSLGCKRLAGRQDCC
ncbi:phosphatidylserine decarboxylase proenzyme, mitochondrial-like [Dendronephthya gigantea]|uniref:phosphatidylserine decarboxylase proenzyme, mitochondrial-like n=1 Tax=Dendronephthya gigantea TaxID=151771 RepID=UPI00106B44CB|nr:phosphatidylserine decarboxylase proenzyme, mitochondrial-like [Dendronephthya gigantea]